MSVHPESVASDPTLSLADVLACQDRVEVYHQSGGWAQVLVVVDNKTNGEPGANWANVHEDHDSAAQALCEFIRRALVAAREAEREACARLVEVDRARFPNDEQRYLAKAIRERAK